MKKLLSIIFISLLVSSCNNEPETLKSPCVGGEGSPCVKRPANMTVIYSGYQV